MAQIESLVDHRSATQDRRWQDSLAQAAPKRTPLPLLIGTVVGILGFFFSIFNYFRTNHHRVTDDYWRHVVEPCRGNLVALLDTWTDIFDECGRSLLDETPQIRVMNGNGMADKLSPSLLKCIGQCMMTMKSWGGDAAAQQFRAAVDKLESDLTLGIEDITGHLSNQAEVTALRAALSDSIMKIQSGIVASRCKRRSPTP